LRNQRELNLDDDDDDDNNNDDKNVNNYNHDNNNDTRISTLSMWKSGASLVVALSVSR